jgi:hypothetical protein
MRFLGGRLKLGKWVEMVEVTSRQALKLMARQWLLPLSEFGRFNTSRCNRQPFSQPNFET